MTDPVRALAFGPHPDDVELFCGGTVARLVAEGHDVAIVDLTRGELATRGTTETRAAEAAAAAKILGVRARENLQLPDGRIDPAPTHLEPGSALARCVEVIRRYQPELILFPQRRARHPDHEAAHALVRRAAFLAGLTKVEGLAPHRPELAACYSMRFAERPSFVVDVGDVYEVKRRAVSAYASQVRPRTDATLVGAPGALEALEARDRYHGSLVGADYGEAFSTESTIGTRDPILLLRAPSGGPRLFWEVGP